MATISIEQQSAAKQDPVFKVDLGRLKARMAYLGTAAWCLLRNLLLARREDPNFVELLSSPFVAAVIAVLALTLGTFVSVFGAEMRQAMLLATHVRLLRPSTYLSLHIITTVFWLNLFLWTRLLYLRLLVEQTLRDERIRKLDHHVIELRGAIFRAYNPAVINVYKDQFEKTVAGMRRAARLSREEGIDGRNRVIEAQVQVILRTVLGLVAEFSFAKTREFEVNVMLFAQQKGVDGFPQEMMDNLVFFDRRRDITRLQGLLYTTRALMHHKPPDPWIPVISLPVPDVEVDDEVTFVLPGAPHAFITGAMNVYEDTRNLHRDYPDLDAVVRRDMRRYFTTGGPGSCVRSFASFRIGAESRLGVLNISRTSENVLGPERQYYPTFHALITPYLHLLAGVLDGYAPYHSLHDGIELAERLDSAAIQVEPETLPAGARTPTVDAQQSDER